MRRRSSSRCRTTERIRSPSAKSLRIESRHARADATALPDLSPPSSGDFRDTVAEIAGSPEIQRVRNFRDSVAPASTTLGNVPSTRTNVCAETGRSGSFSARSAPSFLSAPGSRPISGPSSRRPATSPVTRPRPSPTLSVIPTCRSSQGWPRSHTPRERPRRFRATRPRVASLSSSPMPVFELKGC